jgi:two-component system, OmpR family, response regulator
MRILIVEDDRPLAEALAWTLRFGGHEPVQFFDGAAAETALENDRFDLLILDLSLPRVDGLDVLRHLRERGAKVPVLILSASCDVGLRVRSLDLGADDYMVKPFAAAELSARVRALGRRGLRRATPVMTQGPLTFDPAGRSVELDGRKVELSVRELTLLEVLLRSAGRLVSKNQLADHLLQMGDEVGNNAIEVYIHRIRRKIDHAAIRITTVRGIGYCLERTVH